MLLRLLIETGSWINPKPIALENRKWYGILFTCIMSCFSNFKCFETEIRNAKYFSINYFSITVMVVFIMLMLVVFNVNKNTSFDYYMVTILMDVVKYRSL